MIESVDYNSHLPSYRSLLNPNARYDYTTHSLVPISQNELNLLSSNLKMKNNHNLSFKNLKHGQSSSSTFKMKYKSLLSDVSRTLSIRLSNPYLIGTTSTAPMGSSSVSTVAQSSTTLPSSRDKSLPSSRDKTLPNSRDKIISPKVLPPHPPRQLKHLPVEILDYIFFLVDSKNDYKSCLYTCKLFYFFAKPYYYENLAFTSTYRLAQFVSYLRLNSEVGQHVKSIDLSGIVPGYDEEADENDEEQLPTVRFGEETMDSSSESLPSEKTLAGWRDWKFKNNPLYTVHHYSSVNLTKIASNSQVSTLSNKSSSSTNKAKRFSKPFKYLKEKRRRHSLSSTNTQNFKNQSRPEINLQDERDHQVSSILARNAVPHPLMNKFLQNYSTSKDVPIGYILHLINLCPNIVSLNLGNLSLSVDYEISRSMIYKYQTFDLMNNYPKDLVRKVDHLLRLDEWEDSLSYEGSILNRTFGTNNLDSLSIHNALPNSNQSIRNSLQGGQFKSNQSITSTSSSVYSLTFTKPILKYNSLLPPLPQTVTDISYLNKGDGKVYLSDLNLKSINNNYLRKLNEDELLSIILKQHGNKSSIRLPNPSNFCFSGYTCNPKLQYVNLSSMIWLNKRMVENFLKELICDNSVCSPDSYASEVSSNSSLEGTDEGFLRYKQDLVIDLTDSGMYKNLSWARRIDLDTIEGCNLVDKIMKDELYERQEEFLRSERIRRGRMGENYLS